MCDQPFLSDDDKEVEQVTDVPVGIEEAVDDLREFSEKQKAVPADIHQRYEKLVREYIVVVGMPEVAAGYAENKVFFRVQDIQNRLISDYEDDIS